MALICRQIDEFIEEEISKPVEEWVERQERRCREADCNWWTLCLNKVFCWIATFLAKVIYWVVETIVRLVTRTVCRTVSEVFNAGKSFVGGVIDIVVGIVTLNPGRIGRGFVKVAAAGGHIFNAARGLLGLAGGLLWGWGGLLVGIFAGAIIDSASDGLSNRALRNHVVRLLTAKYGSNQPLLDSMKEALGTEHGVFGLRLKATAFQSRIDSTVVAPTDPTQRALRKLHGEGKIDLFKLSGPSSDESEIKRFRPDARITSGFVGGGGGSGVPAPSEDEIKAYVNGSDAVSFEVLSIEKGTLESDVNHLRDKFRDLGIIIDAWDYKLVDVSTRSDFITIDDAVGPSGFLLQAIGRPDLAVSAIVAQASTCAPVVCSIFPYKRLDRSGIGLTTMASTCVSDAVGGTLGPNSVSGATFRDRALDYVYRWLAAHELGHTFGLCHAKAGYDRIMYQPDDSDAVGWRTLYTYLLGPGEPSFTLDEAKAVWTNLVRDMPPTTFSVRP